MNPQCISNQGAGASGSGGHFFVGDLGGGIQADSGAGIQNLASIIRIDMDGTQSLLTQGGPLVTPVDLAIEADGNLLVADSGAFSGAGGVIRVDTLSGTQTPVAIGGIAFRSPAGITVLRCDRTAFDATVTNDGIDDNPGDGWARTSANQTTLRAAVMVPGSPAGCSQSGSLL